MAKTPKRKRRLPQNITERPDSEIIEKIFGKRVKKQIDKVVDQHKETENKGLA